MKEKLERCGFCGRYFIGERYLTSEELDKISQEELDKTSLGYCPNARQEDYEQNPENYI
jgi:hypothetical protein